MAQYKTFSTMGVDESLPDPSEMGDVPSITSAQHRSQIIQKNHLVVIDNYTDSCGPCRDCAPHFSFLAGKYSKPSICALVKEDAYKKYGGLPVPIRGVPCFHFYLNGQFLHEESILGADMKAVEEKIKNFLNVN